MSSYEGLNLWAHFITLIYNKWKKDEMWAQNINIPLDPPYTTPGKNPTTPAIDEIETILPSPDAFKSGWASWHEWNTDSRLVDITEE